MTTKETCLALCALLSACAGDGSPPPARFSAALAAVTPITFVTLDFDDGRASQLRIADLLADRRGLVPATFFLNSDRLGATGYYRWDDLARLVRDGHELAGHNLGHTRML